MKRMADNRWGCRMNIALSVLIYYRGSPVARCRSSNISHTGMFIEVGPLTFFRGTPLEVEFGSSKSENNVKYRFPATVVYSNSKGVGIMLDNSFMPRISHDTK